MKYLLLLLASLLLLIPQSIQADSISETPVGLDNEEVWWNFDGDTWKPQGTGIEDLVGSFDLEVVDSFLSQSQISQSGDSIRSRGTSPTYSAKTKVDFDTALVGDFSISFFVRVDTFSAEDMLLLFSTEGVTKGWAIFIDDSNHNLNFAASTDCVAENNIIVSGNTVLSTGIWYHIVLTYTAGGNATIYINSNADAGGSIASVCFPALPLFFLGGAAGLDLYLDEVHIYDDVLNSSERASLKNIDADNINNRSSRLPFEVTDTSGSARTQVQVIPNDDVNSAVDSATLVAGGYLQTDSDDLFTTIGTSLIDSTIFADNGASDSWMTRIPSLPANATVGYDHFMTDSSTGLQRRQTFFSNDAGDTITITDHATLDITTDLGISVQVEIHDNPAATTYFVDKWTANTGYRFGIDSSGDLVAQVDATSLTGTPTETYFVASMRYDGTTLFIYQDNLQLDSVAAAALTANAQDVVLFNASDAAVTSNYVEIRSDQNQPTEDEELLLDFDTDGITETDPGNAADGWTWEGTFTDSSPNAHTSTYLVTADQSDLTIVEGALVVFSTASSLAQAEFRSLWLADFTTDITADPAVYSAPTVTGGTIRERETQRDNDFPMQGLFDESATAAGISSTSIWFAAFLAVGLAIGTYLARIWLPLALFGAVLLILVGVVAELYAPWYAALMGVFAFGCYGIDSLGRSGEI